MYPLGAIVEQILQGVQQLYGADSYFYSTAEMYQELCFCPTNDGLNDYQIYHQPSHSFATPRQQLLQASDQVQGDYLLLNYCGHMPEIKLTAYPDLAALEHAITSSGGVFNSFTSMLVPIVHGRFRAFKVRYQRNLNAPEKIFSANDFYQDRVAIEVTDALFTDSLRQVLWPAQ